MGMILKKPEVRIVEFTLMHREIKVVDIEMDSFYHIKSIKNIYAAAHMPVGTMQNKTQISRLWQSGGADEPYQKVEQDCRRSWI